jgi:hypothetical protein
MKMTTKTRKVRTGEIKVLIAAAGLAGTLGFWNFFSRDLVKEAVFSSVQKAVPTEQALAQSLPQPMQAALELPPLPTLVPPLPDISGVPEQPVAARIVSLPTPPPQPQVQTQPSRIFLGGSKPQPRQQARQQAPVARTRSSR